MIFSNTELFRTEANHFIRTSSGKNDGYYNNDPAKSPAHVEYWSEQLRRCKEGYSVGDIKITGDHYFYLNFCQIKLTSDDRKKEKISKRRVSANKIMTFPDFWDGDYDYFWVKEIAKNGISLEDYKKLNLSVKIKEEHLVGGKNLIIAKARRKGFSYKNAAICANTYNTVRNSTIIIGAYEKKFLYPDGTMTKTSDCLDFLNKNTGWGKKRDFINKQEHKKASYKQTDVDGNQIELGYKSQVIAVTFMDNPDAARGKDANLVLFEEAGAFANLKSSLAATEPSTRSGNLQTGQILIFGCVCAGTKVWTNDGRRINIEHLNKKDGIIGYAGKGVIKEPIIWKKPKTFKNCYRITTSNNKSIDCSYDHPLLWSKNKEDHIENQISRKKVTFKKAEEIKVGDQLMLARQIPVFGKKKMWEPRLVGLLIGDGYYGNGTPELSIGDKDIYDWIKKSDHKITIHKTIEKEDKTHFWAVNILKTQSYLRDLGIYGQSCDRKNLPENIHEYDKNSLAELLSGYFDSDGNVYYNKRKNTTRIVLTGKYRHLLEQVQEQLLKFGVGSAIRKENRKTGYKPNTIVYRLYISKLEDVIEFKKHISFICKHKQKLLDNLEIKNSRQIYNNCYFELNKDNNKGKYYTKHNQLNKLEAVFVKNIECIGQQEVYNLNAGITHTYLTNEFISGNTGGDMQSGTLDFEDIFYDAETYNMISIENQWDDNTDGTFCGFYFPDKKNKDGYIDKNGNSNEVEAENYEEIERETLRRTAKDKKILDKHIVEYSNKPKETFLRIKGNIFPTIELQRVLGTLEAAKDENNYWIGDLLSDEDGKIEWKPNKNLRPILEFPIKDKTADTTGCVIVYEPPYEVEGLVPHSMYIAGIDPYDHDQSKTGSLGSTLVYNRLTKRIVAEYTARPETSKEYYEVVRKLLIYYNARALYENEKKGIFDYFDYQNCTYLLADQPECLKDVIQDMTVRRGKGMHMNKELKDYGEGLIKTDLIESYDDRAPDIKNLHKIRSQPLIKELIAYDGEINVDRVMAYMLLMYYKLELRKYKADTQEEIKKIQDSSFFTKDQFAKKPRIYR